MTATVIVHFSAQVDMSTTDPDDLEAGLGAVMEELEELGAPDPAVSGALASGKVEIELTFTDEVVHHALSRAVELIRQALDTAGFSLPDAAFDEISARRELVPA